MTFSPPFKDLYVACSILFIMVSLFACAQDGACDQVDLNFLIGHEAEQINNP